MRIVLDMTMRVIKLRAAFTCIQNEKNSWSCYVLSLSNTAGRF